MAKILETDVTLKEHAKNDLDLELESFEVGDANVSSERRLLEDCLKINLPFLEQRDERV